MLTTYGERKRISAKAKRGARETRILLLAEAKKQEEADFVSRINALGGPENVRYMDDLGHLSVISRACRVSFDTIKDGTVEILLLVPRQERAVKLRVPLTARFRGTQFDAITNPLAEGNFLQELNNRRMLW